MAQTHERLSFGEPFYACQCALGEAPLYRAEDDTLHFVNPLAEPAEIHILPLSDYNAQTTKAKVLELSDSISVATFRKDHPNSYIGARTLGFAFIDEGTGKIENLKQILPDSARGKFRFNDGAVDSKGRLWAGEMDLKAMGLPLGDPYKPQGRLWRYDPDGSTTQCESGIYCSNGIGWSPDNKHMYYNDSYARVVWRYDYDEEAGTISNRIDFIDFREPADDFTNATPGTAKEIPQHLKGGEPDGMVLDTDGNIWTAIWGKGCLLCFDKDGRLLREIVADDAPNLTCPAWAGKDLDILYCTSAYRGGIGGKNGGAVFKLDAGKRWGVKGMEKYRFG